MFRCLRFHSGGRAVLRLLSLLLIVALGAPAGAQEFARPEVPPSAQESDFPANIETHAVFRKPVPESVADLLAIEEQVKKLADEITARTVGVRIGRAHGSGVIVSRDGYVLTAAHVSGVPGRPATIILPDGRMVEGKTLGLNRSRDAGLMKITEEGDWPFAEMADGDDLEQGAWCVATGHPGGYHEGRAPVVRLGRVILARDSFIQTDCTLVGGDSGGPLFDMQGRVIGIHSRIGASTAWNFHVPISSYAEDWDRLAAGEEWGGPSAPGSAVLGVQGEDHERGCRVNRLVEGFPAEAAGLQVGDVIVSFEGKEIKDFDGLQAAIRKKEPGDEVTLELLRGDEIIEKTVVLARLE